MWYFHKTQICTWPWRTRNSADKQQPASPWPLCTPSTKWNTSFQLWFRIVAKPNTQAKRRTQHGLQVFPEGSPKGMISTTMEMLPCHRVWLPNALPNGLRQLLLHAPTLLVTAGLATIGTSTGNTLRALPTIPVQSTRRIFWSWSRWFLQLRKHSTQGWGLGPWKIVSKSHYAYHFQTWGGLS